MITPHAYLTYTPPLPVFLFPLRVNLGFMTDVTQSTEHYDLGTPVGDERLKRRFLLSSGFKYWTLLSVNFFALSETKPEHACMRGTRHRWPSLSYFIIAKVSISIMDMAALQCTYRNEQVLDKVNKILEKDTQFLVTISNTQL